MKLHVLEIPLQRNLSMYQKIVKDEIDRLNGGIDGDDDESDGEGKVHKHIVKWYLVKMTNTSAIAEVIVDIRTSILSMG